MWVLVWVGSGVFLCFCWGFIVLTFSFGGVVADGWGEDEVEGLDSDGTVHVGEIDESVVDIAAEIFGHTVQQPTIHPFINYD